MTDNALTITPPEGSHWEFDEVRTKRGTETLGDAPILIWDSVEGAVNHYGEEGVKNSFDGTSFRVSYQGIARRMKIAGKSNDEIAAALVEFKPGNRTPGVSTPASRAGNAAKKAVAAGVDADKVTKLLEAAAAGEIDLSAFGL
jgi:hypothetical protein